MYIRFAIALLFCLAGFSMAWADSGLDDDRRMIDGLLQRQLFVLAERYAAERIVSDAVSPTDRAEMGAELVRAYTLHAMSSSPYERDRWWKAAASVLPQFQTQFPDSAALIIIQVQSANSLLARLRLLRQEGEVFNDEAKLAEAQTLAAEVVQQYEQLQKSVDEMLRLSHSARQPGPFTPDQLLALSRRVTLSQAEAFEEQGLSYPLDSLDRTSGMSQAIQTVEPLTKLRPDTGVLWPSRLLEMRALRSLGRLDEADARAAFLLQQQPPAQVALAANAERIRVALARNDLEAATQIINQGRELDGQISPEFDFACFETFLELWKQAEEAKNAGDVQKWQNRSAAVVKQLDQLHGSYWARRAEQQLTGTASTGGTENLDLIRRTAEGYVRQQQWAEALKNYDLGAAAARRSNQGSGEYEMRLAAAAVALKANDLPDAVRRLRETALEFPAQKDASLRHLTAAYYQSQIARQSNPPQLEPYIALLRENLSHWPEGEPAAQAAMWLAQIEFSQGHWRQATEAYLQIPPTSTHFASAVEGVRQASLKWFQTSASNGQLVPMDVKKVIDYFEKVILQSSPEGPEWTPTMRLAAESAAQLWLNYTNQGYGSAKALLDVALQANPNAPEGWRSRLESLQVIALAGLGNLNEAKAKLQQARDDSPTHLFEVLQALGQMSGTASPMVRPQIAEIELTVIGMLKPNLGQLDAAMQMVIHLREAEALAASGKLDAAIQVYQQLVADHPNEEEVQLGLARMLSRGSTKPLQEQALTHWRTISRKSRTKSPAWYEAKLEIARCHVKLGDPEEAKQVVRYLQTLYPDMGGPEMKSRFVHLMQQISNP
ncbi:tetratricopeptide repeat protein [Bremerella sp. JC817]|uniref:tetratricopeptide repeat protein n=1 Tax=Bremerella sp. JC817 TaxID=3231756 RepID=UPI0034590551